MTARCGVSRLTLVAAWALAFPVAADERLAIEPSIEVSQAYESNAAGNGRGDAITYVRPAIEIARRSRSGQAILRAQANGRRHARFGELDTLDPSVNLELNQAIVPRVRLFGSAAASQRRATDPFEEDGREVRLGRPEIGQYSLLTGVSYSLSRTTRVQATLSSGAIDYAPRDPTDAAAALATDYDVQTASVSISRVMGSRDSVGISVARDVFDFATPLPSGGFSVTARQDTQLRLALSWSRAWSPRWSMSVSGGPRWLLAEGGEVANTWIRLRAGETPDFGFRLPDRSSRSTGLNGTLSLTRSTPVSRFSLELATDLRPSAAEGSSVDQRSLSATVLRRLGRRLTLRLSGTLSRSESDTTSSVFTACTGTFFVPICPPEVTQVYFVTHPNGAPRTDLPPLFRISVSRKLERESLRADARLSWEIARRISAFAAYGYSQQSTSNSQQARGAREVRSHRFQIGLRMAHDLDPF